MQTFPFKIDYYVTDAGRKPFKEWIEALRDVQGRAKIRIRLDRARLGNLGDNRSIGEGVHELRINYGPGYRVYYGLEDGRLILLLLGGDKSSQAKDITNAKKFWKDYQGRTNHD